MFKMIETWTAKRRAVAELSRLSDRALADIGIVRSHIAAVAEIAADSHEPAAAEQTFPLAGHRHVPAWA